MKTQNAVTIHGAAERIFELAARVEDWPKLLSHYRRVEILSGEGNSRIVSMHCIRSFGPFAYPCRWRARQELRATEGRILFTHLAGPAKGMAVEWRLESTEDGVLTTITHELDHPLGRIYADRIIGPLFISAIAGKTLQTLKTIVESEGKR